MDILNGVGFYGEDYVGVTTSYIYRTVATSLLHG